MMMEDDVHDPGIFNDGDDALTRSLRQQSGAARLAPSSQLRSRTLDALRTETSAHRTLAFPRRPLMSLLAAAAMIALAVLIYTIVRPKNVPVDPHHRMAGGTQTPRDRMIGDSPGLVSAATVRLANFSQPLEREAQALKADLRRAAQRVRQSLPRNPLDRNDVAAPANPSS